MQSPTSMIVNRIGSSSRIITSRISNLSTVANIILPSTTCATASRIQSTARLKLVSCGQNASTTLVAFHAPEFTPVFRSRNLSSVNAVAEDKPKKRRNLETKDPIVLTERAADRIKTILQGENAQGALGIRLGVKRRGCNGLSYTLNYAFEKPKKDVEMQSNGVKVFVEPMALFSVVGTIMDWEETELSSEFTFKNPNSKGECGCGESFTV